MQSDAESNTFWGMWLRAGLEKTGASMIQLAKKYRDLVADDKVALRADDGRRKRAHKNCAESRSDVEAGRRKKPRKAAYEPKGALSLMINGKKQCGPVAAWRWGAAIHHLSAQPFSSGLEALLAAGHRAEVIAVVGLMLKRWFVDLYDQSDPMREGINLQAALIAVASCALTVPISLPTEECRAILATHSDALTTIWNKWLRMQNPGSLWPNYNAAYVILSKDKRTNDDISLAHTILTHKGYDFGCDDFIETGSDDDAARMYAAEGDMTALTWLHKGQFENPTEKDFTAYDIAACALLSETTADVSLAHRILLSRSFCQRSGKSGEVEG